MWNNKKKFLADNTKVPYNNKIFKRGNRNLPKEIDINYIYDLVTAYRCNIDLKEWIMKDFWEDIIFNFTIMEL